MHAPSNRVEMLSIAKLLITHGADVRPAIVAAVKYEKYYLFELFVGTLQTRGGGGESDVTKLEYCADFPLPGEIKCAIILYEAVPVHLQNTQNEKTYKIFPERNPLPTFLMRCC